MLAYLTEKLIMLEGTYNLRELGGYRAPNGQTILKHKLLRSDGLHSLSKADEAFLIKYGVRTIIDLRSTREVEERPDTFMHDPDIQYVHVPFLDRMLNNASDMIKMDSLANVYIDILKNNQPSIKKVFNIISYNINNGVLFHCAAGKDRTGVIAMLLLLLCDIEKETIIEDYSWSATLMEPVFIHQKQKIANAGYEVPAFIFESNKDDARITLQYIEDNYENVQNYLVAVGIEKNEQQHLKEAFLGGKFNGQD
jgi:protein-tyrosine phosphatase